MLGNADQIKERMEQVQAELAKKTVEADAGAGAVRVTVNGKFEVVNLTLDPSMLAALTDETADAADNQALLEDLIAAAVNEAMRRAQEMVRQEMMSLAPGLNLPGLTDPNA
ncbi:MAG: YbaB/EbfC family nucleoid-associated protein [Planctomycetes bacterium]|nr:YbaB/EbfC family nucleoid-associated protein [Planctomycetota bacterium]